MDDKQEKQENPTLNWILGIGGSLIVAILIWVGSTLQGLSQSNVRIETQVEEQGKKIEKIEGKVDVAYYTSLDNQKRLDNLQLQVKKQ